MGGFGRRAFARAAAAAVLGVLAFGTGVLGTHEPASAQIEDGGFDLFQVHQEAPVGRAWANATRTVEYWAYVEGEYRFANFSNGSGNPWNLRAVYTGTQGYASFADFKAAVLADPRFDGKTLRFQDHSVSEEVVEN